MCPREIARERERERGRDRESEGKRETVAHDGLARVEAEAKAALVAISCENRF